MGDADAVSAIFGKDSFLNVPMEIQPGIWGVRIDPKAVLEEYIHKHIKFGFIADKITGASLFNHLAEATPGLREVMTLGQIWRFEKGDVEGSNFDMIIVDSPATGHGLSLLKQPGTLIDMLQFGPIARQTKDVFDLLSNRKKTGLVLVTLPEELPVNEAIEFMEAAETEMPMPVDLAVINAVYPELFTDDDEAKIREMENESLPGNDLFQAMLESAQIRIVRRRIQRAHIDKMRKAAARVTEIPFYFTNDITLKEAGEIASLFMKYNGFK